MESLEWMEFTGTTFGLFLILVLDAALFAWDGLVTLSRTGLDLGLDCIWHCLHSLLDPGGDFFKGWDI